MNHEHTKELPEAHYCAVCGQELVEPKYSLWVLKKGVDAKYPEDPDFDYQETKDDK